MNTFGRIFRVSLFGESHGSTIGIIIDGCPPGIPLTEEDFTADLQRRKSGAAGTTPRIEEDRPILAGGIFQGYTTGAPLTILFQNQNTHSEDYSRFVSTPRPGHADFTGNQKFKGFNDPRGGGHFSGRITLTIVAAGVIAKKILAPTNIQSSILEIGGKSEWHKILEEAIAAKDSLGGIAECWITGVPAGWGEPFFDSVESNLAHILFAIPAIKGVEFGSGFAAARMKGSEHNDRILNAEGKTVTQNAGGINGGISNGNDLIFRVAIKPTSSIRIPQQTFNFQTGKTEILEVTGRHDACIALRIPPVIEAAAAIALADFKLLYR